MYTGLLAHPALRLPWRFRFGNNNPTEPGYHDRFSVFPLGGEKGSLGTLGSLPEVTQVVSAGARILYNSWLGFHDLCGFYLHIMLLLKSETIPRLLGQFAGQWVFCVDPFPWCCQTPPLPLFQGAKKALKVCSFSFSPFWYHSGFPCGPPCPVLWNYSIHKPAASHWGNVLFKV